MKIDELASLCLGNWDNTVSVERPITPDVPNEILFSGKFFSSFMPKEIRDMEFKCFSINTPDHNLRADIVIYVD